MGCSDRKRPIFFLPRFARRIGRLGQTESETRKTVREGRSVRDAEIPLSTSHPPRAGRRWGPLRGRAETGAPTASTAPACTASARLVKHLPVLSRGLTSATGLPWLSSRPTMREAALFGLSTSPTTAHERWRSIALPASVGARSSANRLATRRAGGPESPSP